MLSLSLAPTGAGKSSFLLSSGEIEMIRIDGGAHVASFLSSTSL